MTNILIKSSTIMDTISTLKLRSANPYENGAVKFYKQPGLGLSCSRVIENERKRDTSNEQIRVGNTKHENLLFRVSCIVFRVYRYKHENPKSKHETNTKKVETRKNTKDWNIFIQSQRNWKIYIQFQIFKYTILQCVLAFHPFILRHLLLVSSHSISLLLINVIIYEYFPN